MTNDAKLIEFRTQIAGVLNAVRVYETRAPNPAELNAEAQNFTQDLSAMQRWIAYLRNDPMDTQQHAAAIQVINMLIASLEHLAQHAATQGHLLKRVIVAFIAELRNVEAIPATGAGGAGTPAVQQAVQQVQQQTSYLEKRLLNFDQKLNTLMTNLTGEIKVSEEDLLAELTNEQKAMVLCNQALQNLRTAGIALVALNQSAQRFANELKEAMILINNVNTVSDTGKLPYVNKVKLLERNLINSETALVVTASAVEQKMSDAIDEAKKAFGNEQIAERLGRAAMKNVRAGLTDTNKIITELGVIKTDIIEQNKLTRAGLNIVHRIAYGTNII